MVYNLQSICTHLLTFIYNQTSRVASDAGSKEFKEEEFRPQESFCTEDIMQEMSKAIKGADCPIPAIWNSVKNITPRFFNKGTEVCGSCPWRF